MDGWSVSYRRNDAALYRVSPDFFATPQSRKFEEEKEVWSYETNIPDGRILLSRKSLFNLFEIFKFLQQKGWAMPSFESEDLVLSGDFIKLARPWRLVKDPSGILLNSMQRGIDKSFREEGLGAEEKCLFHLLKNGIKPLELETALPMFYAPDRLITFIFSISTNRFSQGTILAQIDWITVIKRTPLNKELVRQECYYNKPNNGNKTSYFRHCDLMHFFVFIGNAIRHFDQVDIENVNTIYDLLDIIKKEFKDVNLPYAIWLRLNPHATAIFRCFKSPDMELLTRNFRYL